MTSLLETRNAVINRNIKRNIDYQDRMCNQTYTDIQNDFFQKNNFAKNEDSKNITLFEKNENVINPRLPAIKGIIDSKYYLIQKIGNGSSAKVYLGVSKDAFESGDMNQIKYYSIKVIDPSKTKINMFQKEVELLQKLNHENILKIYDYGMGKKEKTKNNKKIVKDIYYLVMEYLEHDEFLKYINKVSPGENKGFGEDLGRLIFAQLLDGLEAMHSNNVFHRDIKPENIMIGGKDYKFKYVDFGFCTDSIGRLDTYLGTPTYAAPELHLKRPYFAKSEDIFSLGVTLFIIVTGGLPFKLAIPNDSLYRYFVKTDYVEYWRKRMVNVSPSFMELFDNMVAFDYSQRPSISEIRESAWMKEINWELLPYLKQELILRENRINERKREEFIKKMRLKQEMNNRKEMNNFSLLEPKKQVRYLGPNKNNINNINNVSNVNNMNIINNNNVINNNNNNKIIIEDINSNNIHIKDDDNNKLYKNDINNDNILNNVNQMKNVKMPIEIDENKKYCEYEEKNEQKEIHIHNDLNDKEHNISDNSKGFIKLQIESKNLNIVITKIKKYLKNKGYFPIKRNFDELELMISNGEIDILLKIERYKNDYAKLNYFKIKGTLPLFELFKKEIQSLKTKVL
jgi:serine/threonine protein kinase